MEASHLSTLIAEQMRIKRLSDGKVAALLAEQGHAVARTSILRFRTGQRMPGLDLGMGLSRILGISPAKLLEAAAKQGGE